MSSFHFMRYSLWGQSGIGLEQDDIHPGIGQTLQMANGIYKTRVSMSTRNNVSSSVCEGMRSAANNKKQTAGHWSTGTEIWKRFQGIPLHRGNTSSPSKTFLLKSQSRLNWQQLFLLTLPPNPFGTLWKTEITGLNVGRLNIEKTHS